MQEIYQTLRAICEQRYACNLRTAYTDEHFSQQKSVFLQLPTSSHLASLQNPTSSGRQINSSRRQPANIMPPFFFSYQPSQLTTSNDAKASASTNNAGNIFSYRANLSLTAFSDLYFYKLLPSFNIFPVLSQPPTKKTEPSAQLFPLYISSTFPGLYNPQFSSCSTKPKCLRMPAKSGSLLLSSVITGLSFFSHSRLNSISLLPRPL